MNKYLSDRASRLTPYIPGEQLNNKDIIKLNTNENPYPVSQKATEAMERATHANLAKYPRPECEPLRQAIADIEGLPSIDYVYAGNGSDEILAFCFYAFFDTDRDILFPDITYSFYPVYCNLYAQSYREIPLDDSLQLHVDDYDVDCAGIVVANPNAPTGEYLDITDIRALLDMHIDRVVLVDEAYIHFGGVSAVDLIEEYPNLLIVRTLSKSHALAGLRCGYALGQPHLIEGIIKVKNSFNSYSLDTICQAGATQAILDHDYMTSVCQRIVDTRERFATALSDMGFVTTHSLTNFVFAKHPDHSGQSIYDYLRSHDVLVRRFDRPTRISSYLRISIGTDSDMDRVLELLHDFIG